MAVAEICEEIKKITTSEDLDKIYEAMNQTHTKIKALKTLNFSVNDKVKFDYKGERKEGIVIKVNKVSVKVKVGAMMWKVSPSFLTKI